MNHPIALLLTPLLLVLTSAMTPVSTGTGPSTGTEASKGTVALARSPAGLGGFVANGGQWEGEVRYFASGPAAALAVYDEGFALLPVFDSEAARPANLPGPLFVRLPGAGHLEGVDASPTAHHFFLGDRVATGVQSFKSLVYRDVQPGISVALRSDGDWFAYDVLAEPGADLEAFAMGLEGGVDAPWGSGQDVTMALGGDVLIHRVGATWQEDSAGSRTPLSATTVVRRASGGSSVAFSVPDWDRTQRLVIDPTLIYATYIGMAQNETLSDMASDATGSVYLHGRTSQTMPTTPGAFKETMSGSVLWVGKLAAEGTSLAWATFLGGTGSHHPGYVQVHEDGSVIVTGRVWSTDFPTTPGSLQPVHGGGVDTFITRISPAGDALIWSTFLGGSVSESLSATALAPNGDVVLSFTSTSPNLPATPGAFDTTKDASDHMIARIAADGSHLVFATWLQIGRVLDLAVDALGYVYFAGDTNVDTGSVPITPNAFQPLPGNDHDAVIGKFAPSGSALLWCTYLGGSSSDMPYGLAVDDSLTVYVAGLTTSLDFPATPQAFATSVSVPKGYGFAARLSADGRTLIWSSYIGGCCTGGSSLQSLVVDAAGNLIAAGTSNEHNWPTTPDALFPNKISSPPTGDVVLSKFNPLGTALEYSTYWGGHSSDSGARLAITPAGQVHLAHYTLSSNLPTTPGAYQPDHGGGSDFAVAAFDLGLSPWRVRGGQSLNSPRIPNLAGQGSLAPGATTQIALRGGVPSGVGWLVLGVNELSLPLPQFTAQLYPWPDLQLPLFLNADGAFDLVFPWPNSPSNVYLQMVGFDPLAPGWIYFSNGLATAQS